MCTIAKVASIGTISAAIPQAVQHNKPSNFPLLRNAVNPIDLAIRQHIELLEKIGEVNKNLRAIQLAPITVVYLISVSMFFYLGRINEWIWVSMTLYPMTPLFGDRFLKWFDIRHKP